MRVAKTKALISFAVTAKLICAFVFAYADCWFSHEAAHFIFTVLELLECIASSWEDCSGLIPILTHSILFMGHRQTNRIALDVMPRCDAAECGIPSGAILFA